MTKQAGMGDGLFVSGYDVSGDIQSLQNISSPLATLDMTDITESAHERQGGLRSGLMEFASFFDNALLKAHPVLDVIDGTDDLMTYCRGTALGQPAACLVAKEIAYDGTRDAVGNFTFKAAGTSNSYGLEWGQLLTAGVRTDTAATNGTGVDYTAVSTAFGWQAYLHVMAFTGTDVTVKLQDSADNVTFADLTTGAFTQITSTTPQFQRIQAATATATVRRYVRAISITTGGFNPLKFAVVFVKNPFTVVSF